MADLEQNKRLICSIMGGWFGAESVAHLEHNTHHSSYFTFSGKKDAGFADGYAGLSSTPIGCVCDDRKVLKSATNSPHTLFVFKIILIHANSFPLSKSCWLKGLKA
jgi:hypothetical protein